MKTTEYRHRYYGPYRKSTEIKITMSIFKIIRTVSAIAPLAFCSTFGYAAFANTFPDVRGTWSGSYQVAFPNGHPDYPDQSVSTSMELEVYKQEGNLIWVINRWRRNNSDDWVIEYGTGTFDLDEQDELVIAEKEESPEIPGVNTGMFIGEYEKGALYLNYIGVDGGMTFSVELRKR
ncbi:MAG: hypothetical protein AAGG02_15425 [Cyanobacteria bacterium P01_H01_bin.15]